MCEFVEKKNRYYVLVLCAGGACQALRDANRNIAFYESVHAFIYTCSLLTFLAGMDAIPPALFPQCVRIAVFGAVSALFLYVFVDGKIQSCGPHCPKGTTQTCILLRPDNAVLTLHACFYFLKIQ